MPDEITKELMGQGVLGIAVIMLTAAVVTLWRRLTKERDENMQRAEKHREELKKQAADYAEDVRGVTAAMVEWTMFVRGKQK